MSNSLPPSASHSHSNPGVPLVREGAVPPGTIAKALCASEWTTSEGEARGCRRRAHPGKPGVTIGCPVPQIGTGTPEGFRCAACAQEAFLVAAASHPAMSEVGIVALLVRNPKGADGRTARERAVLALDALQTEREQVAGETIERNFAGWQGPDAKTRDGKPGMGRDFASQIAKLGEGENLHPGKQAWMLRLLIKYGGQLARIATARAARRAPAPAPAPAPALPEVPDLMPAPAKAPRKAKAPAAKKPARKGKATKR